MVPGVLAALTLAGCAAQGSAAGQGSPTPRADLAGQAEVAARNLRQQPAGTPTKRGHHERTPGTGRTRIANGSGPAPEDNDPVGSSGSAEGVGTSATWQPVRLAADARGDHGNGPAYADLGSLTLEDDGTRLRVTFELGGTVPGRLADGEVQGVGLDLYRSGRAESDFQVFLDGGSDGWHAYLQTPRGFVSYPGTLTVDGRMLVAVVPWSALGGRGGGQVSAFADWSDGAGASSSDTVDRGPMQVG